MFTCKTKISHFTLFFMNIEKIRKEYTLNSLEEGNVDNDPVRFFGQWIEEAIFTSIAEPTAMVVSTIGADGYPQSRAVLLKTFSDSGFTFFTNYMSQKGRSLEQYSKAALLFFWPELQRQVRITGNVSKVSPEVSENYFSTRPRGSQIGAWASEQSTKVPSRKYLEKKFGEMEKIFEGKEVQMPENWGGYIVKPTRFEFWQGRESRLHDRIVFELGGNGWQISRLAP
jgi:pyridoxamine 5'-phosphate oxidase